MSKIIPKNLCLEKSGRLTKQWFRIRKYSESDKDKEILEKEQRMNREKGSNPKAESIQEEKYFHKEEIEQLKELKKKLKEKSPKTDENK